MPLDPSLLLSGLPQVFLWCATFGFALAVTAAAATDVVVFTDASHPIHPADGIRVVLLDAPASLEARLSGPLPADPRQAEALARQRLAQANVSQAREIAAAWHGVTEAWGLGIATLPAVVVDHRYVVYGDPDVAHAVDRIVAWRSARP